MRILISVFILAVFGNSAFAAPPMSGPRKQTLSSMFSRGAARWARKPIMQRYEAIDKLPPTGWFTVDISKQTNMAFADDKGADFKGGWIDMGPNYDLRTRLKPGKKIYYGVPFNIIDAAKNNATSCIVFNSERFHANRFPKKAAFKVGKKSAYLYFLHASAWSTWGNTHSYIVEYKDGTSEEIMVRHHSQVINQGENLLDWHASSPLETADARPVPLLDSTGRDTSLRFLYTLQWRNPHPKKTIKQIKVNIGKKQLSVLILIAIAGNSG